MKKLSSIIFCASLCLVGCTRYCPHPMPDDMASYVPDLEGKTFVYVNSKGDTLTMVGSIHYVRPDEEISVEFCSKCDYGCGYGEISQSFRCYENGVNGEIASIYLTGANTFHLWLHYSSDKGYIVVTTDELHASFDEHEHFVTRDFGDTLVLTCAPSHWDPIPDTAIWVRGVGMIRLNDYNLIDVHSLSDRESSD